MIYKPCVGYGGPCANQTWRTKPQLCKRCFKRAVAAGVVANPHAKKPVDAVVTDWSAWSGWVQDPNKAPGHMYRERRRTVRIPAQNGGNTPVCVEMETTYIAPPPPPPPPRQPRPQNAGRPVDLFPKKLTPEELRLQALVAFEAALVATAKEHGGGEEFQAAYRKFAACKAHVVNAHGNAHEQANALRLAMIEAIKVTFE